MKAERSRWCRKISARSRIASQPGAGHMRPFVIVLLLVLVRSGCESDYAGKRSPAGLLQPEELRVIAEHLGDLVGCKAGPERYLAGPFQVGVIARFVAV